MEPIPGSDFYIGQKVWYIYRDAYFPQKEEATVTGTMESSRAGTIVIYDKFCSISHTMQRWGATLDGYPVGHSKKGQPWLVPRESISEGEEIVNVEKIRETGLPSDHPANAMINLFLESRDAE